MEKGHFGVEQFTEEDRVYDGSRYGEVREAIFANPYQRVGVARMRRLSPNTKSRYRAWYAACYLLAADICFGRPPNAPSISVHICAGVRIEKDSDACSIRTGFA